MEARSFICLNCQCHLKLDTTQRRPESANADKKAESEITESLSGHSRNLMKLIGDAQFPSDAPVCKECSDALLKEMDAQLSSLEEECSSYKTYLEHLKENHPSSNIPELKTKLQNMQDEERSLELQLQQLLIEEERIDIELQQKRRLAEASNEQSVELWKKYRDNLRKVMEDQDELTALEGERQYADLQYRKLTDTNVLDLCFHIWIEGNMGEINGFRLGYLKEQPIEWTEINAALGQVVLLIEVLFERLGIQHRDLTPVAMGSHSYIKCRRNGAETQCPMYGNGSPFTGASAIDGGIRKCLELIEFLQKELKDKNKQFKPPYQIHADGIIENGVKFTAVMMLNIDSRWTRAMAMMLANLKAAMVQCESLRPPV